MPNIDSRLIPNRVVHTGFLRPNLVNHVNVPRLDRNKSDENDLWIPYPSHRAARPSYLSQYFDESCNLCDIARDMSRNLFAEDSSASVSGFRQRQTREELYESLRNWHDRLPESFEASRKPPPHIILLRCVFFFFSFLLSLGV